MSAAHQEPEVELAERPPLERWLEALLDARTIHYLFGLGGFLCVAGVIVWLASLGVFKDALFLGVCLIAGNAVVLTVGLGVALRTPYRIAGHAVTFLACVLAPLNLWYLHAQGLLTVDNHLWMGSVVCSVVFAAVVRLLREPLHAYAVEAGVTLTVLLLLADFNRATDPIFLAATGVALAAASLAATRGFPDDESAFSRRRFFAPLFWSAHVQLGAGLAVLAASQLFGGWPNLGRYGLNWIAGGFDGQPWLAGLLWSAAAGLYTASHRWMPAPRAFGIAAVVSMVFAGLSIVNPYLGVDGRILTYAVASAAFAWTIRKDGESKLGYDWIIAAGLTLGLLATGAACLRVTGHTWYSTVAVAWPLVAAAAATGMAQFAAAGWVRRKSGDAGDFHAVLAGASVVLSALAAQQVFLPTPWDHGVRWSAIAAFGVVLVLAAIRLPELWSLAAQRAGLTVACIAFAAGFANIDAVNTILHPSRDPRITLPFALLAAEFAAVCALASRNRNSVGLLGTSVGGLLAIWLAVGSLGLSAPYFAAFAAALGLAALVVGRLAPNDSALAAAFVNGGRGLVLLAMLAVFFQSITTAAGGIRWNDIGGFALAGGFGGLASFVDGDRRWRQSLRTLAACCFVGVLLDVFVLVDMPNWRKAEFVAAILGTAIVLAAYAERLTADEDDDTPAPSYAWFGALLAGLPPLCGVIYQRFSVGAPALPEEFATLSVAALFAATGLAWRFRATTLVGLGVLGVYLAVMIGQLAYHPQIEIGVYLAVGGGLLFVAAALLAVYREALLKLPSAIENRQGVFQVLDWR